MNAHWKRIALGVFLVGVAVLGPIVAYAGITVIYPSSQHTVNVAATPPLTFTTTSTDYSSGETAGFLGSYTAHDNAASFTITVSGLSGGNLTIDKYLNVTRNAANVVSFKFQIASALSGTLSNPTQLKLRLWAGSTAPTSDSIGTNGLCAVLDLEAAATTETASTCVNSRWMQLVAVYPTDASGSSAVSIRPSSVTFS